MSYREHPLPPPLRPWLACTWERVEDGQAPVRVLPDGCIDVVWTEGAATLAGPNTTAFLVPGAAGRRTVGARMRPGGAPALLGVNAEAVRDGRPQLQHVLGEDAERLAEAMGAASDPAALLTGWLARRARRATAPDPVVGRVVSRLSDDRAARLGELGDELGISERALRRRVTGAVGYGPKRLARVLRLRRALTAVQGGEALAGAAFLAGYADQAHFNHDCRELAGVPPSALVG